MHSNASRGCEAWSPTVSHERRRKYLRAKDGQDERAERKIAYLVTTVIPVAE